MHRLQPPHKKLAPDEAEKLLKKYGISKAQLPKILKDDPALPPGCNVGDIVKIERKGKYPETYYRVVI